MSDRRRCCIVNLGLFRSGTTTLAHAAESIGLRAYRQFPELFQDIQKGFLHQPEKTVLDWYHRGGFEDMIGIAMEHGLVCDGWTALLAFLPQRLLNELKQTAERAGVKLEFVASTRDVEATVQSELHHWVSHDLEKKAGLDPRERMQLVHDLRDRATKHHRAIQDLCEIGLVLILPLGNNLTCEWPKTLSAASNKTELEWSKALVKAGKQNASPSLPVEGILLTFRFGTGQETAEKLYRIDKLLDSIEEDTLCRYLVVLAIDAEDEGGDGATQIKQRLESRLKKQHLQQLHWIVNPSRKTTDPFPICSIWDEMTCIAWENGADWVVLLGDDIELDCTFHYRAFYRSFLDIANRLNVPFGFGCPWWNDQTFPGFASFPCVGKAHKEIFGGLIPAHRRECFVNQDLDPYLHQLYLKFQAAPCVKDARLFNRAGGNMFAVESAESSEAVRYQRVETPGWRDLCQTDRNPIHEYLPRETKTSLLVDVIVPSYRVRLDYLESICSLKVPDYFATLFIIIVDNPDELIRSAEQIVQRKNGTTDVRANTVVTVGQGERLLQDYLTQSVGNNVRVRCNPVNVGASASRNRGLDESAAEFVLHLDDDLVPTPDLLEQYGRKLLDMDQSTVGLVGLVRFPRCPTMPLRHAAVLMSYLTFMFEIAESNLYTNPAWGVTANILFRRTNVRFDLVYAKTGGGEDVDYSLSVRKASNGGQLLAVPEAAVVHPFWPGSVWTLAGHFFNWAIGDGALFGRFPELCYWSYPNAAESLLVMSPILFIWFVFRPWKIAEVIILFLLADFLVDYADRSEFQHRCRQVDGPPDRTVTHHPNKRRSPLFYVAAHVLANFYVVILECGRLYGHVGRNELMRNIFWRFDWHCGALPRAPHNFRRREAYKFGLFTVILVGELWCFLSAPTTTDGKAMIASGMVFLSWLLMIVTAVATAVS
jgi:glycosyltransferase involved in cell wall biosynthesis